MFNRTLRTFVSNLIQPAAGGSRKLRRLNRQKHETVGIEQLEDRALLTLLFQESFEAAGPNYDSGGAGVTLTPDVSFQDGSDHYFRTNGSNISNSSAAFSGQHGSFYWAGEDVDDTGGGGNGQDQQQFLITGIDISGHTNIVFSGLFAADGDTQPTGPGGDTYEFDDGLRINIQVDGNGFQNAIHFESAQPHPSGGGNDFRISRDTNFDGVGENVDFLDSNFQTFTFDVTNLINDGSTLDIQILMEADGQSEEMAFDNLQINGDAVVTNQAPTVTAFSAADVGEPEIGDTSYSFTVTYNDNSAVDVSTIDINDVTVTGPGGPLTITNAVEATGTDGSPKTATYTVTPPGGSWDAADNGTYTVDLNASEVGDDGGPQLFAASGNITSFNVAANNTDPTVDSFLAEDVINPDLGGTSYSFTVTYADVGGVDVSSIDTSDVTVTGPGGPLTVTGAVESSGTDGSPKTATYTVTPPGGTWDATDDGTYTIGIVGSQVQDVVGASVAANASLTTFEVNSNKLLNETFETDGQPSRYTASQPFTGASAIWNRTDGTDHSNVHTPYSGQDRSFYWAAEDVDNSGQGSNGNDEQQFDITGINTSGFTNLTFMGSFAADGDTVGGGTPGGTTFEFEDHIQVLIQVDGGGYQNAIWFESVQPNGGGGGDFRMLQDTDFDGIGDGTALDSNFQSFNFDITNGISDGSTVDVRILVQADGTSEELAFDSLMITGTPIPSNTPPAVSSFSASDVGEPEIGLTSYSFDVTYNDNSAVDVVGTIDINDVTVTGPGGPLAVTGVAPSNPSNGTPRTVTYTVTPPGGSWDATDNGTYTVDLNANEVGDDGAPQLFAAAGTITTFNVAATNTDPVVDSFLAEDVINPNMGDTSYSFTLTYSDVGGVSPPSFDVNDVTVTGPGGPVAITGVAGAGQADGSPRTATYTLTPPGGSWDSGDNGTYTIGIVGGEVLDILGASVAANASLTTFEVNSNKLLNETFETDGQPSRYTASQPFTGASAIWNRTDGTDHSNVHTPYSGQDRSFYWAAEDVDNSGQGSNGNDEQQFDITGINTSGFTNLTFMGSFAADGDTVGGGTPGGTTFEFEDHIQVLIQVDGGGYQNAIWFESVQPNGGGGGDFRMLQDTDFDGIGDGTALDSNFQSFNFDITNGISDGSTVDVRILVQADGTSEELAFDSLMITGTALPPEVSVAVAPPAVDEDGPINMEYTFTRTGDTANPLTVNFDVGGGATLTTDYTASGAATYTPTSGTVTIPGGSSTATVTIDPVADTDIEQHQSVILTVATGAGYTVSGTSPTALGTILNDDDSGDAIVLPMDDDGLSYSPTSVGAATEIIDNGAAGHSSTGFVNFATGPGHDGDYSFSAPGNGSANSTWTFNVTPGRYRVSATWESHPNRATNAPFEIQDNGTPVAFADLNQELAPDDFSDAGSNWEDIATVDILGTTITVILTDAANDFVIADAIRIESVTVAPPPDIQIMDDGDSGYTDVGFTDVASAFEGDYGYAGPGNSDSWAAWTFDVTPGRYQISTTWLEHPNRATNAPYLIYDGVNQVGDAKVNQEIAPNDFADGGANWENIGVVDIAGSKLRVVLHNNANQFVITDAVRIEKIPVMMPDVRIVDNGDIDHTTTGFNTFSAFNGFNGDYEFENPGIPALSTWTFDVNPGTQYSLSTTWAAHPNRATDAPFSVYDGNTFVQTFNINQELAPNDFSDAGSDWEVLVAGIIPANNTLTVTLSNTGNEYVIADAVRIEDLSPMMASVEAVTTDEPFDVITAEDTDAAFESAISYWAGQGVSDVELDAVQDAQIVWADLSGRTLGLAGTNTIFLDDDAAGFGWTLDDEPGHMNLQIVVNHELGHLLGFEHDEDSSVMMAELSPIDHAHNHESAVDVGDHPGDESSLLELFGEHDILDDLLRI